MIEYRATSLFDSPAQTLVNAVNTVGVMGKGLAAQFKVRYPEMFETYRDACKRGELTVGQLQLVRVSQKWVLNFPTKQDWRKPSRLEWVEAGLKRFTEIYVAEGITSAAFPRLGCGLGGLEWSDVQPLMERYLTPLPIPICVHELSARPLARSG